MKSGDVTPSQPFYLDFHHSSLRSLPSGHVVILPNSEARAACPCLGGTLAVPSARMLSYRIFA